MPETQGMPTARAAPNCDHRVTHVVEDAAVPGHSAIQQLFLYGSA